MSLPNELSSYQEFKLDIVPGDGIDYVASIVDMAGVPDNEFDVAYMSHALEHVYQHEVVPTLKSFLRVLKPGGFVIVIVPNLDGLSPTDEVLYESAAGPITARDMFYGMAGLIEDHPYMAHKTGFVPKTLESAFKDAGFPTLHLSVLGLDLIAIAAKGNE